MFYLWITLQVTNDALLLDIFSLLVEKKCHHIVIILGKVSMTESSLICFLNCSANMSTTSRIMVSSISYYHSYGTSLSATRCCFTSWISNASSHGPYTGMKTFSISFNKMGWLHGSLLFSNFLLIFFLFVFFFPNSNFLHILSIYNCKFHNLTFAQIYRTICCHWCSPKATTMMFFYQKTQQIYTSDKRKLICLAEKLTEEQL